jgi:hypothetical protein
MFNKELAKRIEEVRRDWCDMKYVRVNDGMLPINEVLAAVVKYLDLEITENPDNLIVKKRQ